MSAAANPQSNGDHQQRILLVEDEVLIRMDLASELQVRGFEVYEAGHSAEAKRILDSTQVDLVLTDINMPGAVDGIGLARWVISKFEGTKVAVISGQELDDAEVDLVDAFFEKEIDMAVLMERIRSLLR